MKLSKMAAPPYGSLLFRQYLRQRSTTDFNIIDATKTWPEELVPLKVIGELFLDRPVDEFFPETEQAAFCTADIVPGIGSSDYPL